MSAQKSPSTSTKRSSAADDVTLSTTQRSIKLRNLSVDLLRLVQSTTNRTDIAPVLEQITPQLERHVSFQRKIKQWQFGEDFDAIGTELFNVSTRLARSSLSSQDKIMLCHLRVVSILLLECGRRDAHDYTFDKRLLKASIKTARLCCEYDELPLSYKTLERAADFEEEVSHATVNPEEQIVISELQADYLIARLEIAVKDENDELLEFLLGKTPQVLDLPIKFLTVVEMLFEYGTSALRSGHSGKAVTWLQRCFDLIEHSEQDTIIHVRAQTIQNLVRAYLTRADDGDLDIIAWLLDHAAKEFPVASWLFLLRAEYTCKKSPSDTHALIKILESTIRIVQITDVVFQSIIKHVRIVSELDISSACQVLDLLISRTAEGDVLDWLEKALVTRVWLTTRSEDTELLRGLNQVLNQRAARPLGSISLSAASAAQVLLWKVSDNLYLQHKYGAAIEWCQTCRADIFSAATKLNDGKFLRRLMLCYIELGDHGAAQRAQMELPQQELKLALTRYIMYRANRSTSSDEELLANIHELVLCEDFTLPLLYHCAMDATTSGRHELARGTLELVLARTEPQKSDGVLRLPILLRCMIRLNEEQPQHSGNFVNRELNSICAPYELAAKVVADETLRLKNDFTLKELEWFSKNAHNLAVKVCATWPTEHVKRMLNCIKTFLDAYPKDIEQDALHDLEIRKLLCLYLLTSTTLLSSRSESLPELKLGLMQDVCRSAQEYRLLFEMVYNAQSRSPPDNVILGKLGTVLVFEFEALIHTNAWGQLNKLVQVAETYHLSSLPYNCMAELILSSTAPMETISTITEALSAAALACTDCDMSRLAKWLRIMFTLCLAHDDVILLTFCAKLLLIIKDNTDSYPTNEMQWLAARSFNHAVDLHAAGNAASCHRMCEVALNFGNYSKDEALKVQIQQNYQYIINAT